MNLLEVAAEHDGDHDGFRCRGIGIGERIGAALLGGSVYDLPPGESTFPFHFHYGVEEWLVVLAGHPTLRTPDGEQVLGPWDTACFPAGPAGAHPVRNDGDESARVLMLSTKETPSISVYPDSDKIGTRPGGDEDRLNFVRSDAVDYWAGE
ncbi:MAG TPA: cupin domain-containing protein [Gaiellaceae bacterium]